MGNSNKKKNGIKVIYTGVGSVYPYNTQDSIPSESHLLPLYFTFRVSKNEGTSPIQ